MRKIKTESGRSMLEVLAVLAIIGLLSVGTLLGYSYLIQRHKRLEAVKLVQEAVVSLNTTGVVRHVNAGERVDLGEAIKSAHVKDGVLHLPTGEDDYAIVTAMEGDQFALALQASPDVCRAILGSFSTTKNVVLADPSITDRSVERSTVADRDERVSSNNKEAYKTAVIEACTGPAGAVFNCGDGSISYGYDYGILCKNCPSDRPFWDGTECCAGPGQGSFCDGQCACRNGLVCDKEKIAGGMCVVCTTTGEKGQQGGNEQCWKAYHNKFAQHVCKESTNTCVECLADTDCYSDIGPQNDHTPNGKENFRFCVGERCIPCKMNYEGNNSSGAVSTNGECPKGKPLCTATGCEECPTGTVYDVATGSCVCPSGTIMNPNTKKCVKCYDSNKGTDTDRGCENETGHICNETGSTMLNGTAYPGECIACRIDNDCIDGKLPDDYCSVEKVCTTCPTDKPHFNYDDNVRQCYKCIDDHEGASLDTGCGSDYGDSSKRLCERTSVSNPYGNVCHVCQNTNFGAKEGDTDPGCGSEGHSLCGTNTENGFAEVCYKCMDDKTGATTDTGCLEETPICVVEGLKNDGSKTFGNSCTKCINDKDGAVAVDTGCTDKEPMCVADAGAAGSECTACPPGTIPNPKTGECVYCYDSDTANASTDKGCSTGLPHCDESKTTTVDGKSYKGACFFCNGHYQSNATLPCGQNKPVCHDRKECVTCTEISAVNGYNPVRPIWSSEKQGCYVCADDKANVGQDSGCTNDKRLCSDVAGSEKYATGNTKDAINGVCYQCITDKNCVDLNINKKYCANHVCVDCGTDHCIDHTGACIALSSYIDIKRGNDGKCECYNTLKSAYVTDDGNSCNIKDWDTRKQRRTSSRQRYYNVPKNAANFYCTYKFRANGLADDWVVSGLSDGIGRNSSHDSWAAAHDNTISPQYATHKVHGNGQQKKLVVEDRWLREVGYRGEFLFELDSAPNGVRHSGTKTGVSVGMGWNNGGVCDNIGGWRDKR